jgi:anti-anti-sigma factor
MMTFETRRIGQTIMINLAGRLDSISTPQIQARLFDETQIAPGQKLILNMADVNYLSAAGLRLLHRLQERAGAVCITAPSSRVREVLSITGLDVVYKLYETSTAALHSFEPVTNAHTHLEFSWLQQACPDVTGMNFVSWIRDRVEHTLRAADKELDNRFQEAAEAGIQALVDAGTTMVGDVSLRGLSIEPLITSGLRGIVYLEMLQTHPAHWEGHFQAIRDLIDFWRGRTRGSSTLQVGLELHAPYSIHPALWEKALQYAHDEAVPLCIHVAESPAEAAYLRDGSGDFNDYYSAALPPITPPGTSPIAYLAALGALDLKPLLIHAVQVDDDDIQRIKDHACTVVHCPRSNLRLRCGRMPLEKFLAKDIPVLLGTDSLASSPSLNILEELDVAVALHHGYVAPEQVQQLVHNTLPGTEKTTLIQFTNSDISDDA